MWNISASPSQEFATALKESVSTALNGYRSRSTSFRPDSTHEYNCGFEIRVFSVSCCSRCRIWRTPAAEVPYQSCRARIESSHSFGMKKIHQGFRKLEFHHYFHKCSILLVTQKGESDFGTGNRLLTISAHGFMKSVTPLFRVKEHSQTLYKRLQSLKTTFETVSSLHGRLRTWNGSPCQNGSDCFINGRLPNSTSTELGNFRPRLRTASKHHSWQSCASEQTVFETLTRIHSRSDAAGSATDRPCSAYWLGTVVWKYQQKQPARFF